MNPVPKKDEADIGDLTEESSRILPLRSLNLVHFKSLHICCIPKSMPGTILGAEYICENGVLLVLIWFVQRFKEGRKWALAVWCGLTNMMEEMQGTTGDPGGG